MPRPKKESVALNIRLDKDVNDTLVKYCEETGQTKTTAIERMLNEALKDYFEQPEGKRIPV